MRAGQPLIVFGHDLVAASVLISYNVASVQIFLPVTPAASHSTWTKHCRPSASMAPKQGCALQNGHVRPPSRGSQPEREPNPARGRLACRLSIGLAGSGAAGRLRRPHGSPWSACLAVPFDRTQGLRISVGVLFLAVRNRNNDSTALSLDYIYGLDT